ncbi:MULTISPECIES: hypothetical protein [unclassified Brevundimonas]|uniref:hypothetical protein n=1 Tax=unclassified Brevundimonas TaxID=2622653 RepID=UPI0025C400EA|nr:MULTISPECIES: hypothetical protein [unclassified Brevundimonas]
MKLSSILCGAAAVALLATSAQAHGYGLPGHGNPPSAPLEKWGEHVTNPDTPRHQDYGNYNGTTWDGVPSTNIESRWAANRTVRGNIGDAGTKDGATFTLRGTVTPHCVFYTGTNDNLSFNFGQIGVYASENHGPALAFDQVAGASLHFRTNLAGCNTKNKVQLSRTQASLKTTPQFGYDSLHFTTEIPYSVKASFRAPGDAASSTTATDRLLQMTAGQTSPAPVTFGAWKSPMTIIVDLGKADKSLVAGEYTGSFNVVIQAL